jgi:HEPN domain-containing protein
MVLLRKAREDAEAVQKFAADRDIADSVVGFHAQQAAEKALKAVLASRAAEFRWTHDLRYLMDRLDAVGATLPASLRDIYLLLPWAVEFRYGETIEDRLDRDQAVRLVRGVIAWAVASVEAKKPADDPAPS